MLFMAALTGAVSRVGDGTIVSLFEKVGQVSAALSEIQQSQSQALVLQNEWSKNPFLAQQVTTIIATLHQNALSSRPAGTTKFAKVAAAAFSNGRIAAALQQQMAGLTPSSVDSFSASDALKAVLMAALNGAICRAGDSTYFNLPAHISRVNSAISEIQSSQPQIDALQYASNREQAANQQMIAFMRASHEIAINAINKLKLG
jgi:hypothetical protein